MKNQDFVSVTFNIPWDYELIIETRSIKGLVKTATRQDLYNNSIVASYFFNDKKDLELWVNGLSPILKECIIK